MKKSIMFMVLIALISLFTPAALAGTSTGDLKADDPEVRADACLALADRGEKAIPLLFPLLNDRSMLVRHCAAYALSRIGGTEVESIFRENLNASGSDLRRISAAGLAMIGMADYESLLPLIRDPDPEVRWSAAFALGRCRDRRALTVLKEVSEKDPYFNPTGNNYPVREAAAASIHRLNSVIGWLTDPERAFRQAAREKKPLMLYFRRDGSQVCEKFECLIFTDEKIIDVAQRFTSVWLDYRVCPGAFDLYGVAEVPTIIFLSWPEKNREVVKGTVDLPTLQRKMLSFLENERSPVRLLSRLEKDPENPELNWQLAQNYMEEGQWESALQPIHRIIKFDPDNVSSLLDNALFARAYIRGRQGNYSSAYREFEDLLQRFQFFGDRAESIYCCGLSALKAENAESGIARLRQLREEYPDSDFAAAADSILEGKKNTRPVE